MTLSIYKSASPSTAISQSSTFTSPFAITFDGRTGGYKETQLFVRNDNALHFYTGLQLSLEDSSTKRIVTNTTEGFAWKLAAGDTKPTYNDWLNTAAGNTITLSNIGSLGSPDTSTYLPFWLFIQVPEGLDVQLFRDVKFALSGTRSLA